MRIDPFIKRDYITVDAFDGIKQVRYKIIANKAAVVLKEKEPIGLITAHDLVARPYNLVIDCLSKKPVLSPSTKISEALELMEESNSDVLTVFENDQLIGTLFKGDITIHLMDSLESHRYNLQDVAHDLRSPIANLMGIINIFEDSVEDPDSAQLVSAAKTAYTNANNLIDQLLKPVTSILMAEATFEIRSLLEDCIRDLSLNMQKKDIELTVSLPDTPKYSEGNEIVIKRAVGNILNNAIKFTGFKGKIMVSSVIDQIHCTISIADTGIGIPEDIKPFLFERFSSAQRPGTHGESTTGLGLHICKSICDQYEIGLDFESTAGHGTTFHLKFKLLDH